MEGEEFKPDMIEKSSIIACRPKLYKGVYVSCSHYCEPVLDYLKDKEVTQRRLAHFTYCMRCDSCNHKNIKDTHPQYTSEYLKLLVSGDLKTDKHLTLESYKKTGIVGIMYHNTYYVDELMTNNEFISDIFELDLLFSVVYTNKENTIDMRVWNAPTSNYAFSTAVKRHGETLKNGALTANIMNMYHQYLKSMYKASHLSSINLEGGKLDLKIDGVELPHFIVLGNSLEVSSAERTLRKMVSETMFCGVTAKSATITEKVEEVKANPKLLLDMSSRLCKFDLEQLKAKVSLTGLVPVVVNTTDEFGDEIDEYYHRHIFRYVDFMGRIHQFTPPSIKAILRSDNNSLPSVVVKSMAGRDKVSKLMSKPFYLYIDKLTSPRDLSELVDHPLQLSESGRKCKVAMYLDYLNMRSMYNEETPRVKIGKFLIPSSCVPRQDSPIHICSDYENPEYTIVLSVLSTGKLKMFRVKYKIWTPGSKIVPKSTKDPEQIVAECAALMSLILNRDVVSPDVILKYIEHRDLINYSKYYMWLHTPYMYSD